jgi:hypothetical protein
MRAFIVLVAAGIPALASAVPINLNSGVSTVVGGTYESANLSGTATLNVLGGSLGSTDCTGDGRVQMTQSSSMNVAGGDLTCIYTGGRIGEPEDNAVSINVLGGHIGGIVSERSAALINVFGGVIDSIQDSNRGPTFTNLYGGQIGRISSTFEEGSYNFFGYGFELTCLAFNPRDPERCLNTNVLKGFWADGTAFETLIRGDDSTWNFSFCSFDTCDSSVREGAKVRLFTVPSTIPEPGTFALFAAALGGIVVFRRRRNARR